jgi:hypothetical protein
MGRTRAVSRSTHRLEPVPLGKSFLVNGTFEGKDTGGARGEGGYSVGVLGGADGNHSSRTRIAGRRTVGGVGAPVIWRRQPVFSDDQRAGRQLDAGGVTV